MNREPAKYRGHRVNANTKSVILFNESVVLFKLHQQICKVFHDLRTEIFTNFTHLSNHRSRKS